MKKKLKVLAAASVACLVAACGGSGGGGEDPASPAGGGENPASPAGLYSGTSGSGATSREFSVLVLDTGRFYSLYSGPAGGAPAYVAGAVVGNGTSNGNNFSAATVRDFNFEGAGVTAGSLSATFGTKTSISGTITASGGGSVAFSGNYDADYEQTPSLATVAGTYAGDVMSSVGVETATVTIATNGSLSASSTGGCNATGTVAPRASGNVYNVAFTFGSGCIYPSGTQFDGHAYLDADGILYTILPNAALTEGVLFVGSRP